MNDPLADVKQEMDLDIPLKVEVPEEIDPERPFNIEDPLHVPIDVPDSFKEEIDGTTDENLQNVKNVEKDNRQNQIVCSICDYTYAKKRLFGQAHKKDTLGKSIKILY